MRTFVLFVSAFFISLNLFALDLKSPVFKNGAYIPDRYTCDGKNYSPPLTWSGLPSSTKSLALIVDDPDVPAGIWVHWVIYNIPADIEGLAENVDAKTLNSLGIEQGKNDFGQRSYGGPCPPPGPVHKYSFKLYALSKNIAAKEGVSKPELIKKMQGAIIAETKLSAFYQRRINPKGGDDGDD